MLCPPLTPSPLVADWLDRHRDPRSFVLHIIGIPPTILGVLMIPIYAFLVSLPLFALAFCLFAGGYLVQFLGHALDGSDPGEVMFLKRTLAAWAAVPAARKSRRVA